MKRPVSLGVLGWFLIVVNAIALLTSPWTPQSEAARQAVAALEWRMVPPIWVLLLSISIVFEVLNVVAGFGILKGRPWARMLYTIVALAGLVIPFAIAPLNPMLLPGAALVALLLFLLYRPAASAYFGRAAS